MLVQRLRRWPSIEPTSPVWRGMAWITSSRCNPADRLSRRDHAEISSFIKFLLQWCQARRQFVRFIWDRDRRRPRSLRAEIAWGCYRMDVFGQIADSDSISLSLSSIITGHRGGGGWGTAASHPLPARHCNPPQYSYKKTVSHSRQFSIPRTYPTQNSPPWHTTNHVPLSEIWSPSFG